MTALNQAAIVWHYDYSYFVKLAPVIVECAPGPPGGADSGREPTVRTLRALAPRGCVWGPAGHRALVAGAV